MRVAESLRGFGVAGTSTFVVIFATAALFTPLAVVLVLLWAWLSRTPWPEIGLVRPKSWPRVIALGIVLGVAEKFVMKAIVLPLLGARPTNPVFSDLPGHPSQLCFLLVISVVQAGFGEELCFRGYLFERLGKLLGDGSFQRALIVLISASFFGALHFEQGIMGIVNATIVGGISAVIYALNGKRLWLLVVMHATFDIASFLIIYYRLEVAVSHLIFK
jgi:membrane protease YdiL (CAAX protease family)